MYRRYTIRAADAPSESGVPGRFKVQVRRGRFLSMVAGTILSAKSLGDLRDKLRSRPCIYGVYGGTLGGFNPDSSLCRGCYRCVLEHPNMIRIQIDETYRALGDSYLRPEMASTIRYEASTGQIPIKGAGYGGPFAGTGFDAMWTDMSEIVRPTRDGIHGREYISTAVDIGRKPSALLFNERGEPVRAPSPVLHIPIPLIFDRLPESITNLNVRRVLLQAARELGTFFVMPIEQTSDLPHHDFSNVIPLIKPEIHHANLPLLQSARLIEVDVQEDSALRDLVTRQHISRAALVVRLPFRRGVEESVAAWAKRGIGIFHLYADYHGHEYGEPEPRFVKELIRSVHLKLVDAGIRGEVTLIVSGGIVMAEHVPKAIICGADLVALDTALWVALDARFRGECITPESCNVVMPSFKADWGVQRLLNLCASWRDQLLEILGAMGLREVRRLRGEVGRAMFFEELENEIFRPLFGEKNAQ